jgi:hypothetical protein
MSFTGLFKNEIEELPSAGSEAGGGAFFTQLYAP